MRIPIVLDIKAKYIGVISFLYVLVSSILVNIIQPPDIISSFIALPSLILLPILYGYGMLFIVHRIVRIKIFSFNNFDVLSYLIISWFIGLFSMYVISFFILLYTQSMLLVIIITLIFCLIGSIGLNINMSSYEFNIRPSSLLILTTLIISAVIPLLLITEGMSTFPRPSLRAWIAAGYLYRSVYHIATYGIPDTPYDVTHPMSLNILYAISSCLYSVDPLALIWSVPFLLLILFVSGVYVFTKRVTGRRDLSLVSGIVGAWILSGTNLAEYPVASEAAYFVYALNPLVYYVVYVLITSKRLAFGTYKTLFVLVLSSSFSIILRLAFAINREVGYQETYLPDNLFMIIYQVVLIAFMALYIILIILISQNNWIGAFGCISIALTGIHTLSGLSTVFFASLYSWLLNSNMNKPTRLMKKLQYIIILLIFVYILLQITRIINIPSIPFISRLLFIRQVLGHGFNYKLSHLFLGVSEFGLVLFSLGMLYFLIENKPSSLTIVTHTSIIMLIYFLPDYWSYRVIDNSALFISIAISRSIIGISEIIFRFKADETSARLKNIIVRKMIICSITISILAFLIIVSIMPITIAHFTRGGDIIYTMSRQPTDPGFPLRYEYETALWLRENTPYSTVIISDPVTMDIISSLAHKIPLAEIYMGRPVRNPQDVERVELVFKLLTAKSPLEIYKYIQKLRDIGVSGSEFFRAFKPLREVSFVIVISPRTLKWIKTGGVNPIVYVNTNSVLEQDYISKFTDSRYFKVLFKIENKIYVIKPLYTSVLLASDFRGTTGCIYEDGLVLRLPMDEGKGDTVHDYSYNDLVGKIVNPAWSKEDDGKSYLIFDGEKTYVILTNTSQIKLNKALSIAMWVKVEDSRPRQKYLIYRPHQFILRIDPPNEGNDFAFFIYANGSWEPRANSLIVPRISTWYHIVGVYDGKFIKIYVNGTLRGVTSRPGTLNRIETPIYIGKPLGFHGIIKDIRIYDYALSDEDVKSLYKNNTTGNLIRLYNPFYHRPGDLITATIGATLRRTSIYVELKVIERHNIKINDSQEPIFVSQIYECKSGKLVSEKYVFLNETGIGEYRLVEVGQLTSANCNKYILRLYVNNTNFIIMVRSIYISEKTEEVKGKYTEDYYITIITMEREQITFIVILILLCYLIFYILYKKQFMCSHTPVRKYSLTGREA